MSRNVAPWQARVSAASIILGSFQVTQQTNSTFAYPGNNHGLTFSDGAVTEDIPGDSGMVVTALASPPASGFSYAVTAGTRDILVTMDINTLGTGPHDAFAQLRDNTVSGVDNPFPGSVVGSYGQGSAGIVASVVIAAGTTRNVTRRAGASANNQRLQAGSFIRFEEVA